VLHTTIQVDLVRQSSLGEDLLGLVTLGSWEDLIRFYDPYSADFHLRGSLCVLTGGSNTQWAFDSLQFIRLDKAGMRDESGIQLALLQISDDILSTETVADAPILLTPMFPLISLITASTTGSTRFGKCPGGPFSHFIKSNPAEGSTSWGPHGIGQA
jgi:hypothetical protein